MSKIKSFLIFTAFSLSFVSCINIKEESRTIEYKVEVTNISIGFNLLEGNCFSCHSINPNAANPIAPSMKAIKKAYASEGVSNKEFTQNITNSIQNPSKEKSKMPKAIETFGLMPKMEFSDKQLLQISSYLYATPIEKDYWFENNYQNEKEKYSKIKISVSPLEKGLDYAKKTKAVLGNNLLNAIKTKGAEGALTFCNENAIHLTNSVANTMDFTIKRVSDKNRNPNNQANVNELTYIENAKNQLQFDEKITPQIQDINGEMVGYYPILTNQMCLQCHGNPSSDIQPKTMLKIKELYPDDKAIGYSTNELRGVWVVTMPKE